MSCDGWNEENLLLNVRCEELWSPTAFTISSFSHLLTAAVTGRNSAHLRRDVSPIRPSISDSESSTTVLLSAGAELPAMFLGIQTPDVAVSRTLDAVRRSYVLRLAHVQRASGAVLAVSAVLTAVDAEQCHVRGGKRALRDVGRLHHVIPPGDAIPHVDTSGRDNDIRLTFGR